MTTGKKTAFPPKHNFASLSVKDLLDARDAYHLHLAHLDNVVATAIGRYRIMDEDADANDADAKWRPHGQRDRPRTLQNSVVRPWSWPCVMVFVTQWMQSTRWRSDPDQIVPRFLYLADGRVVPTCVIEVAEEQHSPAPSGDWIFPSGMLGGGYPILTPVQQRDHIGTVACLVTDGKRIYALTNRHVAGPAGDEAYSMLNGVRRVVGKSAGKEVAKLPFSQAYPSWIGTNTFVNLDAGLIEVDDVRDWRTQVYGLGPLGEPIELNTSTITLDLIGCNVRAFGCAGGLMKGQIIGLFHRYKSVGGNDYTADLLIASRSKDEPLKTLPGDSGAPWVFDPDDEGKQPLPSEDAGPSVFRPLAMQWGAHALTADGGQTRLPLALATCLSTICRELDVEVVRGWNVTSREYWGKTGHYKVAAMSCGLVRQSKLRDLMEANRDNIAFDDETLQQGKDFKVDAAVFVPLADVPDYVWVARRKRGNEICFYDHFADMDEKGKGIYAGKDLFDLCKESDANVDARVWNDFYDTLEKKEVDRGKLPFRVWQLYDAMVAFLKESDLDKFLCAAGVLAHYVADACQPLHLSYLSHGDPDNPSNVHKIVDQVIFEQNIDDFIESMNEQLEKHGSKSGEMVQGGYEAALAVVRLMCRTNDTLPARRVVDLFDEVQGRGQAKRLWEEIREDVIKIMTDACCCLALLWDSAWREGGGETLKELPAELKASQESLKKLYLDKKFLPDYSLPDLVANPDLFGVAADSSRKSGRRRKSQIRPRQDRRG